MFSRNTSRTTLTLMPKRRPIREHPSAIILSERGRTRAVVIGRSFRGGSGTSPTVAHCGPPIQTSRGGSGSGQGRRGPDPDGRTAGRGATASWQDGRAARRRDRLRGEETMPANLYAHLLDQPLVHAGKVRELYAVGDDELLMVATDRISAFDFVLDSLIP